MSMLVGLVRPTSGDALVYGKNILTDMVRFLTESCIHAHYDTY